MRNLILVAVLSLAACGSCGGTQAQKAARKTAELGCLERIGAELAADELAAEQTGQKLDKAKLFLQLAAQEAECAIAAWRAAAPAAAGSGSGG